MSKINLIEKDEKYGSQLITIDTDHLEVVESGESLERLMEDGYYCFRLRGATDVVWRSKKSDGLIRVPSENWTINTKLCNTVEHGAWCQLVDWWIDEALANQDFVDKVMSICREAVDAPPLNGDAPFQIETIIDDCRAYLKTQGGDKRGKTGKRPTDIKAFLIKAKTGRLPHSVVTYKKYNGVMVDHPKWPTWKNKIGWKGK